MQPRLRRSRRKQEMLRVLRRMLLLVASSERAEDVIAGLSAHNKLRFSVACNQIESSANQLLCLIL